MKKSLLIIFLLSFGTFSFAQETSEKPYKLIVGARVNPLVIYDFDGNRTEAVRLHGEIGLMWNNRWIPGIPGQALQTAHIPIYWQT